MCPNVAIVIPVYKQFADLELIEKISFEQTCKVFNSYDICFVTHEGIDIQQYINSQSTHLNFRRFNFNKEYFANIPGYNRLLVNYSFYKAFRKYNYMLICQLDVFVFFDKLDYFIKLNCDYIGGPWFENYTLASKDSKVIGAGNGGFSLRKINSFLSVLGITKIFNRSYFRLNNLKDAIINPLSFLHIIRYKYVRQKCRVETDKSIFYWEFLDDEQRNEDISWSIIVRQYFSWFKVASIDDSISFAFEVNPSVLFELNHYQLPMAAHAWHKYEVDFWRPFLEQRGYMVDQYLN